MAGCGCSAVVSATDERRVRARAAAGSRPRPVDAAAGVDRLAAGPLLHRGVRLGVRGRDRAGLPGLGVHHPAGHRLHRALRVDRHLPDRDRLGPGAEQDRRVDALLRPRTLLLDPRRQPLGSHAGSRLVRALGDRRDRHLGGDQLREPARVLLGRPGLGPADRQHAVEAAAPPRSVSARGRGRADLPDRRLRAAALHQLVAQQRRADLREHRGQFRRSRQGPHHLADHGDPGRAVQPDLRLGLQRDLGARAAGLALADAAQAGRDRGRRRRRALLGPRLPQAAGHQAHGLRGPAQAGLGVHARIFLEGRARLHARADLPRLEDQRHLRVRLPALEPARGQDARPQDRAWRALAEHHDLDPRLHDRQRARLRARAHRAGRAARSLGHQPREHSAAALADRGDGAGADPGRDLAGRARGAEPGRAPRSRALLGQPGQVGRRARGLRARERGRSGAGRDSQFRRRARAPDRACRSVAERARGQRARGLCGARARARCSTWLAPRADHPRRARTGVGRALPGPRGPGRGGRRGLVSPDRLSSGAQRWSRAAASGHPRVGAADRDRDGSLRGTLADRRARRGRAAGLRLVVGRGHARADARARAREPAQRPQPIARSSADDPPARHAERLSLPRAVGRRARALVGSARSTSALRRLGRRPRRARAPAERARSGAAERADRARRGRSRRHGRARAARRRSSHARAGRAQRRGLRAALEGRAGLSRGAAGRTAGSLGSRRSARSQRAGARGRRRADRARGSSQRDRL